MENYTKNMRKLLKVSRSNVTPLLLSVVMLLFWSCTHEPADYSWLDEDSDDSVLTESTNEEQNYIPVPYREMSANTIMIPVKINGLGLDMIFDTGASTTCITLAEAAYLYEKGLLQEDEIGDEEAFQTADGNISVGLNIVLREVVIGDALRLNNVEALVVEDMQAPLLLGQSVLKRFKEVSVDRDNKVVKFY